MARGGDRFHVYLAALDPVRGSEIAKTRPCVIVSPEEMNERVRTVIVVPMTSRPKHLPFRVPVGFRHVRGELLTDHIRSIDKSQLVRRLGRLDQPTSEALASTLVDIFQL